MSMRKYSTSRSTVSLSTASQFIRTILSPLLLKVFLIASLISLRASSSERTPEILKKAACMTVLMRAPRPTLSAIFRASMLYTLIFFSMMVLCRSSVRFSKTSSAFQWELRRKVPPSLIPSRMS